MNTPAFSIQFLGDLSIEDFLTHYWQKQPLVIRSQFPDFVDLLEPEELAGLALDDEVESRLIRQTPENQSWHVKTGPFDEATFLNLPESHWTLLVQTLDHWVPEARELLSQFNFIPQWRIDDLMVSYATPNGGVGPHIDQYDVFLIQGMGSRRWQVGQPNVSLEQHTPHPLLKQTAEFDPIIDCVLHTGDMLYIPPNTAHNGIALNNCMTYSVGFRAPSHHSVLEQLLVDLLERDESLSDRYQDANPVSAFTSNKLPNEVVPWVRKALDAISDEQVLSAFGQLVTRPKYPAADINDELKIEQLEQILLYRDFYLSLTQNSRLTYYLNGTSTQLFIDGAPLVLTGDFSIFAEKLVKNSKLSRKELKSEIQDIDFIKGIANLVKKGHLTLEFD